LKLHYGTFDAVIGGGVHPIAYTNYRESIIRKYEWNVDSRENALKDAAEKIRREQEREERERVKLINKRNELMLDAITRVSYSNQIRELVAILDAKSNSGEKIEGFEKWKRWALHQAQFADPRLMSSNHASEWIKKFNLKN
jgi:hypothetical protein